MSNLLQNIGFTLGLISAPALAYAEGVQSGNWVPAESAPASSQNQKAAPALPPRAETPGKATAAPCKPCDDIDKLKTRVRALEDRQAGDQYDSIHADLDRLYETANKMADQLNGTTKEPDSGLADQVNQLINVYQTLVIRIEKNEKDINDPLLDQVRNTFRAGMRELDTKQDAAARQEFDRRVEGNIFGKGRDARRAWFELGLQGRYAPQGAAAGAVVGAVTYRGDRVTVGFGAGAGYGGEAAHTVDLGQAPTSEQQGEYTQVSSQTGTQRTADRYRGHLQLRVATPDLELRRLWAMQVGGIAERVANTRSETVDRTRTIQFASGDQPVGEPHSAHGSETERSMHYSTVLGMAFDFMEHNHNGRALGVRVTGGYNVTDERPEANLSVLGRF